MVANIGSWLCVLGLFGLLGCSPAAQHGSGPSAPHPQPAREHLKAITQPRRDASPGDRTTERKLMLNIDRKRYPNIQFRVDQFVVPDAAREEFLQATRRNFAFIKGLPGFLGHLVLEKSGGPGRFNLSTIAAWESPEAIAGAIGQVQGYYRSIGFNPPEFMRAHGIQGEMGNFGAPAALQE